MYLFISVDNHNIFKRSDEHLYFELPITFTDAALGTSVEVPSIDGGRAKIKIPAGTQHGKQLRLKGKGMPLLRGNGCGDLYIKIITEVPSSLNSKQKDFEEFRKIESEKSSPIIKSFFEKAKQFWKKILIIDAYARNYVCYLFIGSIIFSSSLFFKYQQKTKTINSKFIYLGYNCTNYCCNLILII